MSVAQVIVEMLVEQIQFCVVLFTCMTGQHESENEERQVWSRHKLKVGARLDQCC